MSKQFEDMFKDISEQLDLDPNELEAIENGEVNGATLGSIFSRITWRKSKRKFKWK